MTVGCNFPEAARQTWEGAVAQWPAATAQMLYLFIALLVGASVVELADGRLHMVGLSIVA